MTVLDAVKAAKGIYGTQGLTPHEDAFVKKWGANLKDAKLWIQQYQHTNSTNDLSTAWQRYVRVCQAIDYMLLTIDYMLLDTDYVLLNKDTDYLPGDRRRAGQDQVPRTALHLP